MLRVERIDGLTTALWRRDRFVATVRAQREGRKNSCVFAVGDDCCPNRGLRAWGHRGVLDLEAHMVQP